MNTLANRVTAAGWMASIGLEPGMLLATLADSLSVDRALSADFSEQSLGVA
jgi:hypothetical protein